MRTGTTLFLVLLTTGTITTSTLTACNKSSKTVTSETPEPALQGITEGHDNGSIVWRVTPDGQTRAIVKSADGKPLGKNASGGLVWRGAAGEWKVPIVFDEPSGTLVAAGPKLEGDLTEIKYTITVDGKPWTGALHVPAGGTDELAASAKKAAQKQGSKRDPGPNGGVVQVVGDDALEVVADKNSGQVRVYVLDTSNKPVAIGERKVKLGVVGSTSDVIALSPGPGGLYFTGKLSSKLDPIKLTIALTHHDQTEVVLCGYEPGVVVVVGSAAPSIHLLVAVSWGVDVRVQAPRPSVVIIHDDDDHHYWHGHGHGRGHWGHGR